MERNDGKESIYLSQVDFAVADEKALDEIDTFQKKQIAKSFFKRMLILAIIIGIFVAFQMLARISVPHMFGKTKTVERLLRLSGYTFLVLNILSYVELYVRFVAFFDREKDRVSKFKVKKKMDNVINSLVPTHVRFLVCEKDGHFVLDYVPVSSKITFSNIKEGDYVYVKQEHDDGHHTYELIS